MRIVALISGGKDSLYALYQESKKNEITCLITLKSKNPDSWIFHTINVHITELQAKAMDLPLISLETKGMKEKEIKDLKKAIGIAKEKYKIKGIVSGAIKSNYQKQRIDKLCKGLRLKSISPLWHIDEEGYLKKLIKDKFKVIITSISAEGLNKDFLGKEINNRLINKLKIINKKNKINISGEGGEFETLVLDCPLFKKKLKIKKAEIKMENECTGKYIVKDVRLIDK